ncbi:MAG: BlaI/MecI/CopY family transcriptional regulator [Verrucomicrobiales bacterium]|nr:BlaI/MecI/CopY family transcriptional regulator [Verrucomicrobiales bacterium]
MPVVPRISEAEWEVMKILWVSAPQSASDIIEALRVADRSWHPNTVKTLLTRLVKKGALGFERDGRAYLYSPRVSEADCVAEVSESFLERVFGGSLAPLLAHFVDKQQLSDTELAALRRILERRR